MRPALATVAARLRGGTMPSASEFLALELEAGTEPTEARRLAARYGDALGAESRTTGEDKLVAALRAFRLQ